MALSGFWKMAFPGFRKIALPGFQKMAHSAVDRAMHFATKSHHVLQRICVVNFDDVTSLFGT